MKWKRLLVFVGSILLSMAVHAQALPPEAEMADRLRSSGKIYVVIAVIVIIFAGVIFLLLRTERRLTKIEKQIKQDNTTTK